MRLGFYQDPSGCSTENRLQEEKGGMEAGGSGEATAIVQVENDGGGASKCLFISFYSHSRHDRFNIII